MDELTKPQRTTLNYIRAHRRVDWHCPSGYHCAILRVLKEQGLIELTIQRSPYVWKTKAK